MYENDLPDLFPDHTKGISVVVTSFIKSFDISIGYVICIYLLIENKKNMIKRNIFLLLYHRVTGICCSSITEIQRQKTKTLKSLDIKRVQQNINLKSKK